HHGEQQTARSPLLVEDQAGGPCGKSVDICLTKLGQDFDFLSSFDGQRGSIDLDRLRAIPREPINSTFTTLAKLVSGSQQAPLLVNEARQRGNLPRDGSP